MKELILSSFEIRALAPINIKRIEETVTGVHARSAHSLNLYPRPNY